MADNDKCIECGHLRINHNPANMKGLCASPGCRCLIFQQDVVAQPSLQLLVIDLGHSVLMSHESGREFRFEMPSGREFVFDETCDQYLTRDFSFAELRDAIDGEKPVPRIERTSSGVMPLYKLFYAIPFVDEPEDIPLTEESLGALASLAGAEPLPIYEPTEGRWEQILRPSVDLPFKVWRYTR